MRELTTDLSVASVAGQRRARGDAQHARIRQSRQKHQSERWPLAHDTRCRLVSRMTAQNTPEVNLKMTKRALIKE